MKWYGAPPWQQQPVKIKNKTSDWDKFLAFQKWTEKQDKKRKKEEKDAADAKKKKEDESGKWPTFSIGWVCIALVAFGPIVGTLEVLLMFSLIKKLAEVIGVK